MSRHFQQFGGVRLIGIIVALTTGLVCYLILLVTPMWMSELAQASKAWAQQDCGQLLGKCLMVQSTCQLL